MTVEEGFVTKIGSQTAWVKTRKAAEMKAKAERGRCNTMGIGNDMYVEAMNPLNAKAGDRVIVRFESASQIKISLLIYGIPFISMMIGLLIGLLIAHLFYFDPSISAVILGCVFLIFGFLIARSKGKQWTHKDQYLPKIIRIIK